MFKWKPTKEEAKAIRTAAGKLARCPVKIEAGIRYNLNDSRESVNIRLVTDDHFEWGDTDLADFISWTELLKGIPTTFLECATIDLYLYNRYTGELETNMIVYVSLGKLHSYKSGGIVRLF